MRALLVAVVTVVGIATVGAAVALGVLAWSVVSITGVLLTVIGGAGCLSRY